MKERIVNIFAYVDGDVVKSIGYCVYEEEGTYEKLTEFLRSRVGAGLHHFNSSYSRQGLSGFRIQVRTARQMAYSI